jgi:hypothetical protein
MIIEKLNKSESIAAPPSFWMFLQEKDTNLLPWRCQGIKKAACKALGEFSSLTEIIIVTGRVQHNYDLLAFLNDLHTLLARYGA